MVDGFQGRWLSSDVYSEMWGQRVPAGDAVPCRCFLDGLGGEEVGEEVYGVDPLELAITGQEFFVEGDVPFGLDTGCGFTWWPFDGAVDVFVLEAFIDKATVAGDASGGVPAVDVALLWVHGVRK